MNEATRNTPSKNAQPPPDKPRPLPTPPPERRRKNDANEKPKPRQTTKNKSSYVSLIRPNDIYHLIGEELKVRRTTDYFLRWLEYKLPDLAFGRKQLVAYIRDPHGNKKLRARSLKIARTEPKRTAKRSRAKHVIEQGEKDIAWFEKRRNWLLLMLRFVSPETEEWQRRSDKLRSLKMLPSVVGVVFWSSAFVGLLGAEFNSSANLLMTAGMGFADSWLSALLSIFVVVGLPLVTLKFLDANLGEQGRIVFDKWLSGIALTLSMILISLFGRTIGGNHGEVSLFDNTDTGGYSYWLLYTVSMFGLAVAVAMAGKSLKKTCKHFYEFNSVPNPVFVSITERMQLLSNATTDINTDCNEMRRILEVLDNEANDFAGANCDELDQLKQRFGRIQDNFLSDESNS